ncbi:cellulase family glycosylhydrolase [Oligosphaera ethanolica]|uniref:Glycoside hydrolase family 5 domain-containing protein n=1 Tax=Oligosphaera ethanolica TaxID=760260 RepID=A0AAE3VKN9_9BACT|nr:cellulase family glycosylhydrolase [Oligosphaera ethanolica]MDQ0291874.1 hypothetical protein [Oligosphaera ethanolica]
MTMRNMTMAFLAMVAMAFAQVSSDTPGWVHFPVPGLELPAASAVDMGFLNAAPAGQNGFVRAAGENFVDDRGVPLRFYGTNVTGTSCFPSVEDGRKLAKRLRQYGFNCLRLHFMDPEYNKEVIWEDANAGTLSAERLALLDHFVDALGREGVYANINLHVYRRYPGQPVPDGDRTFHAGKNIDRWYDEYLAHQEDYARRLLGRVNSVNGRRYAEDPAIMCVELNNENTMIADVRKSIALLPESFQTAYRRLWTAWLMKKYGSSDALRAAWSRGVEPLGEVLVSEKMGWYNENGEGAESTLSPGPEGGWRWLATKSGKSGWNLQLLIRNFKLAPGLYTVRFQARSATVSSISHSIILNGEPWQTLGLSRNIALTPEWQDFEFFGPIVEAVSDTPYRVNVSLGNKPGDVEIRGYSIQRGGGVGLPDGESLEAGVRLPGDRSCSEVLTDYWAFMIDTEMAGTRRLVKYLKEEIGCRMVVTDTQVSYGRMGGLQRESELSDYIDIHSYWEHPHFLRDEKGRSTGFRIRNSAALANANGGSVPLLASWRVAGKPFSVSEYNIPAPNDHSADLFPMFSVVAALQDWDAFFSYSYRDFGKDYANTALQSYFHLIGRSNLLVHVPFATLLYRQGRLAPATRRTTIALPTAMVPEYARQGLRPGQILEQLGGKESAVFTQQLAVMLDGGISDPVLRGGDGLPRVADDGAIVSDDGALRFRHDDPAGAYVSLNLPSARMLTGHVAGREFSLGDVTITVAARPWPRPLPAFSCVTLVALDGMPIAESRKMLLAASGRTENQGMKWNDDRTGLSGPKAWGEGPELSEIVPMSVVIPGGALTLRVLDGDGVPQASRVVPDGRFSIGNEERSLWFLLERPATATP